MTDLAVRRLLVLSGSTRSASANSLFCRTIADCAPGQVEVDRSVTIAALPHFDPDLDTGPLPPAVARFRSAVAAADLVLLCTPEYAGTVPGSLKNLLDWAVGGTEFTAKPVAWISIAPDPARGAGARATLSTVFGYLGADIRDGLCRYVPVPAGVAVDAGRRVITDPLIRRRIGELWGAIAPPSDTMSEMS